MPPLQSQPLKAYEALPHKHAMKNSVEKYIADLLAWLIDLCSFNAYWILNSYSLCCGTELCSRFAACWWRASQRHQTITKNIPLRYSDVILSTMVSQITSLTTVYSTVYSGADQRKHQSSASLTFYAGNSQVNAENVSIWWRHHFVCTRILHRYNESLQHSRSMFTILE